MIKHNHVYDEDYYNKNMVIEINRINQYSKKILDNTSKYLETQKFNIINNN